jgi:hypothetical protein
MQIPRLAALARDDNGSAALARDDTAVAALDRNDTAGAALARDDTAGAALGRDDMDEQNRRGDLSMRLTRRFVALGVQGDEETD